MPPVIDLTNKRFGRLVAKERAPNMGRRAAWLCLCDCGNTHTVSSNILQRGTTRSCRCLLNEWRLTHGLTRRGKIHPEYGVWKTMRQRCSNPNRNSYPNYGGRGIKVCERWSKFENFIADMGPRPAGYTIERLNNNGNYEPTNCKWIPLSDQGKNRRSRYRGEKTQ